MRTTLPFNRPKTSAMRFPVASARAGAGDGAGSGVGSAVGTAVGSGVGTAVGAAVGTGVGAAVGATVGSGTTGRCSPAARVADAGPTPLSALPGLSKSRSTPMTVSVVPAATTSKIATIAPGTMRRLRHDRLPPPSGSYGL